MTDEEVSHYVSGGLEAYVAHYAANSRELVEVVRRIAQEQYDSYFPDDEPAPGHELLVLEDDGEAIGRAWVGPHPNRREDPTAAWLFDIEINEPFRGYGYGRYCLNLVELRLARQGVTELALNVFGDNETARQLYASAGYRDVAVTMSKTLSTES